MDDTARVYTPENCVPAYQLNWSLTVFGRASLPSIDEWLDDLRVATEPDGVRVLECRAEGSDDIVRALISTRPEVSPARTIASFKGRLQYRLRDKLPRAFRRNYRIESVGAANATTLDQYVGRQAERHPMADSRMQERFRRLQFRASVNQLEQIRTSSSGQFLHNLHVVLENAEGWHEWREETLESIRERIIRTSAALGCRLSRLGLVSNHLHLTLGCGVCDAPADVAVAMMNGVAASQGMRPVLRFSYCVGTFGNYDRQAIWRRLWPEE